MASVHASDNYMTLYTIHAHVFQLDPKTKKAWINKADMAIAVSFVANVNASHIDESADGIARRELKIIATDGNGEIVLDSIVTPNTYFQRRTQKFGQWTDCLGMIYGLGFNSELEIDDFIQTFRQLQQEFSGASFQSASPQTTSYTTMERRNKQQQQTSDSGDNFDDTNGRVRSASMKNGDVSNNSVNLGHHLTRRPQTAHSTVESESSFNKNGVENGDQKYPRSQIMFGMQGNKSSVGSSVGRGTPEEASHNSQIDWNANRDQLKFENDQLKQALKESLKNAEIWQSELTNLRTNNIKLTQALQTSKANVEDWNRELERLRKENEELNSRVKVLESQTDSDKINEYEAEWQKYKKLKDGLRQLLLQDSETIEDEQEQND